MPNSKPLSYGSLQTVLWQIEASLRITLSSRIASPRNTEKTVPLRIKNLELSNCSISINDVTYTLGVTSFKKTTNNKWKVIQKYGKCTDACDYDDYGFSINTADLTPGDIEFEEKTIFSREITYEHDLASLADNKSKIANRKHRFWKYALPENEDYQRRVDQHLERKMNLEPTVKHFLHLTISGSVHEFIEYNQNLREALKYLNTKILGGRATPIKVENLIILPKGCIRLPGKWSKLEIHNLTSKSDMPRLKFLWPVMSPSSFPLKSITIQELWKREYPLLETAEKVIRAGDSNYLPMPFRYVHFNQIDLEQNLIHTIRDWINVGKEIGACYTYDVDGKYFHQAIEWFKKQDRVVVREDVGDGGRAVGNRFRYSRFPHNFIFPINDQSEISIRFDESNLVALNLIRMTMTVQSTELEKIKGPEPISEPSPFSKTCQKSIIASMDPSFRFLLSHRSPEFSKLEKSVPLKIEYLSIMSSGIVVDGTYFHLELKNFKKTVNGEFRDSHRESDFDVDKFGIRIPYASDSGDLAFGIECENLEIKELNSRLVDLERALNLAKNEYRDFCGKKSKEQRNLRTEIEKIKFRIHQLTLKNKNLEPRFQYFLELRIYDSIQKVVKTELLETNGKFFSAQKYFFDEMLGNRSGILNVKNFAFKAKNSLIKIPQNLKIRAEYFTVKGNKNGLKIFQPILTDFDFESIGLDRIQNSDLEILKKSKKVVLTSDFKNAQNLPPLPYKIVEFCYFSMDHFWKILEDWKVTVPAMGTFFSFICNEYECEESIEQISRKEGGIIGKFSETRFGPLTSCMIFPLSENLEINVYISESKCSLCLDYYRPHDLHHITKELAHFNRIEMKIRPKGFATPLEL